MRKQRIRDIEFLVIVTLLAILFYVEIVDNIKQHDIQAIPEGYMKQEGMDLNEMCRNLTSHSDATFVIEHGKDIYYCYYEKEP